MKEALILIKKSVNDPQSLSGLFFFFTWIFPPQSPDFGFALNFLPFSYQERMLSPFNNLKIKRDIQSFLIISIWGLCNYWKYNSSFPLMINFNWTFLLWTNSSKKKKNAEHECIKIHMFILLTHDEGFLYIVYEIVDFGPDFFYSLLDSFVFFWQFFLQNIKHLFHLMQKIKNLIKNRKETVTACKLILQ